MITLTTFEKKNQIYVAAQHIVMVQPGDTEGALITLSTGALIHVRQPPYMVTAEVAKCTKG